MPGDGCVAWRGTATEIVTYGASGGVAVVVAPRSRKGKGGTMPDRGTEGGIYARNVPMTANPGAWEDLQDQPDHRFRQAGAHRRPLDHFSL